MKLKTITTIIICSICSFSLLAKDNVKQGQTILELIDTFIAEKSAGLNSIIDCSHPAYIPTASHKSLFSWSKKYHENAVSLWNLQQNGSQSTHITTTSETACEKAIKMRGAAYCLKPHNTEYLLGLVETFEVCTNLFVTPENMLIKLANKKKDEKKKALSSNQNKKTID